MGFLSSRYTKPGPGVEKDAPKKPSFFVFFEVLKRKFWNLIKVNMMYVVFNALALFIALYISSFFMQKIVIDNGTGDFVIRLVFAAFLTLIPLITIGPVQAGFTYILRNYSREEHAFIWSDFKENILKNFKQGIIITVIDIFVMFILGFALNVYTTMTGLLSVAATAFTVLSIVMFIIMHFYIYPMLVTVKLNVKSIYKNALIFSLIKFIPNVLMLILNLVVIFVAFYIPLIGAVLYVFILPSFIGLMNNFYANPLINKYVVDPNISNEAEEENQADNDTEGFYKKVVDSEVVNETDSDSEIKALPDNDDLDK